jgi:hypothetical protein
MGAWLVDGVHRLLKAERSGVHVVRIRIRILDEAQLDEIAV